MSNEIYLKCVANVILLFNINSTETASINQPLELPKFVCGNKPKQSITFNILKRERAGVIHSEQGLTP